MYYKQDIQDLVSKTKSFWNHSRCDAKLSKSIKRIHRYIETMQKFAIVVLIYNMTMIGLRPAFEHNTRFVFQAWVPSGDIIWEALVLFSQYHVIVTITPIIFGCDFLYMSLTLHMVSQLRILNYALEHMDRNCDLELIKECVRQHRLILM